MRTDRLNESPDYDRIVQDLTYRYDGVFSKESVAQAVADARSALEPVSRIPTFLPILTARFATQQLTAAAQADGRIIKQVPELLFVCVQNAGRSQIAAALAQHLSGGRVHVRSAGSAPITEVNATAIAVLQERGITLTEATPSRPPTTSSVPPTSWSRWDAATRARSCPASATRTGTSPTPQADRSRPSATSATTSRPASPGCSATSASDPTRPGRTYSSTTPPQATILKQGVP